MRVSANHHPGIRVSDIDRSARFYAEALGGHEVTPPMLVEGPIAEATMAIPGTRFTVCHVGFDTGVIELIDIPIDQLAHAMWDASREAAANRAGG